MLPCGRRAGSVFSAWASHAMSHAKNAESPASMIRRRSASGYVRTRVRARYSAPARRTLRPARERAPPFARAEVNPALARSASEPGGGASGAIGSELAPYEAIGREDIVLIVERVGLLHGQLLAVVEAAEAALAHQLRHALHIAVGVDDLVAVPAALRGLVEVEDLRLLAHELVHRALDLAQERWLLAGAVLPAPIAGPHAATLAGGRRRGRLRVLRVGGRSGRGRLGRGHRDRHDDHGQRRRQPRVRFGGPRHLLPDRRAGGEKQRHDRNTNLSRPHQKPPGNG